MELAGHNKICKRNVDFCYLFQIMTIVFFLLSAAFRGYPKFSEVSFEVVFQSFRSLTKFHEV